MSVTYRWLVPAVLVLAALGLLLWWRWPTEPARRSGPEAPTADPGTARSPTEIAPTASQEHPDLDRPGLAPHRLDVDRRPWDRKNEPKVLHEWRSSAAAAFDRFTAETGISDEKFQKLMTVLYDYQENHQLIHAQIEPLLGRIGKQELETWLDDADVLRLQLREETLARARAVLKPEEYRAWRDMMARENLWIMISGARIIVPTGR